MKEQTNSGLGVNRTLPSTRGRDTLIAVGAGVAVLAFVLYAVYYFSRQADAGGGTVGTIIAKTFVPQPETQITFGQGGLSSRAVAGEYAFRVRVAQENGRVYRVTVNASTYFSHQVGDTFYFERPTIASSKMK